jgi:hypothetical protein
MKEFEPRPNADHTHHVRRVVLPSGKTIEVVSFDDPASTSDDLHICGCCESKLVYPTEWEEAGATHWQVTLRCPNCEWIGSGLYEQTAVERFDEELDRGTEAVVRDLRQLMRANMEDEVERFTSALRAGHVLPEDF